MFFYMVVIFVILVLFYYLIEKILEKHIFLPEGFDNDIFERLMNNQNIIHEYIKTQDNETLHCCLCNKFKEPSYEDTIFLYSHGNSGWLGLVIETNTIEYLSQFGSVFIYDYRGYGLSTGTPSFNGVLEDSRAVWNFLVRDKRIRPDKIILFGNSLGTSVTANLISHISHKDTCRMVILQNPFYSLESLINDLEDTFTNRILRYLGEHYLKNNFRTDLDLRKLDEITNTVNIYLIHCIDDEIIPYDHSVKLSKIIKNNKCNLSIIPGTHNHPIYHEDILSDLIKDLRVI